MLNWESGFGGVVLSNKYKQEEIVTDLLSINQVIDCVPKDIFISKPVCDLGKFLECLNADSKKLESCNSKYSFIDQAIDNN